jgi:hypothetical protein
MSIRVTIADPPASSISMPGAAEKTAASVSDRRMDEPPRVFNREWPPSRTGRES